MPNKQGRAIPLADFNPKGSLIEGLAPIAYPNGQEAETTAAAAESVAKAIGAFADEAAAVEGAAAGRKAGLDPAYRPDQNPTIRGRAYQKAAIDTYSDELDARLRTSLQDTFEQHKDSPANLKAALEQLHATMTAPGGDVFPELRGHFDKQFATLSQAYRNKAQSNADSRARDANLAALLGNLNAVDTATRKALITLDPSDPATEALVADGVARTTAMLDRAAADGLTTRVAAEKQKIETRNSAYGEMVMRRADGLKTADEVAAYRKTFETDFAAGKYDGKLDGAGFDRVQAQLMKAESGMATAARSAASGLKKSFNDFAEREAAGLTPSPAEWNGLVTAARHVPGGDEMVAMAQAKRALAAKLTASSIYQGDAILQKLREDGRAEGITPQKAELIQFGQKVLERERKDLTTDQLGVAQKKGLIAAVAPLDFEQFAQSDKAADAEAFAGQVRDRVTQADAVGQGLSRQPQYLRPEEKARMKEIVDQGGDRALALASSIVKGAGDAAPAILHEIAPDAPKLAQIGAVLLDGGSVPAMRDALTASHLEKVKGVKFAAMPGPEEEKAASATLGQAYLWAPSTSARVRAVAEQIAQVRMQRENVLPKDNPSRATAIYTRALQEATGAVFVGDVQYGGVADYKSGWFGGNQVITPPGVRADKFRDVITSITDDDMRASGNAPVRPDGKAYTARDLQDAIPVRAGSGYAFARKAYSAGGDMQYIVGANGKPFVLDWAAIEPRLRQRRPDLFAGAR